MSPSPNIFKKNGQSVWFGSLSMEQWTVPLTCGMWPYCRLCILKSKRIYQCSMLTLERTDIFERPCNSKYLVVIEWGWADREGCYRPRWITTSEISIILHILRKPNSIIIFIIIHSKIFPKPLKKKMSYLMKIMQIWQQYRSKIIFALNCK